MKTFLCFIFLQGASTALFATNPMDIPGQLQPMEIDSTKLVSGFQSLSHAVRALDRGFSVISRVDPVGDPVQPSTNAPDTASFEAIMADQNTRTQAQEDAAEKNHKATLAEATKLTKFRLRMPRGGSQEIPDSKARTHVAAVEPFGPDSTAKFQQCARRSLPLLYSKIGSLHSRDPFEAASADAALLMERGNGQSVTPDGLPCGKYLGEEGLTTGSPVEEIKILTALEKEGTSRKLLWKVFHHFSRVATDKPVGAPLFWQFAWKRASFHVALGGEQELTMEQLKKQYRAYAGSGRGLVTENLETLDAGILKDMEEKE